MGRRAFAASRQALGLVTVLTLAIAVAPTGLHGRMAARAVIAAGAEIAPSDTNAQTSADLAITAFTVSTSRVKVGEEIDFSVSAINNGPDSTPMEVNLAPLPDNLQGIGATECSRNVSADGLWCEYQSISPGQSISETVRTKVLSKDKGKQQITITAQTGSFGDTFDPNTSNNQISKTVVLYGGSH